MYVCKGFKKFVVYLTAAAYTYYRTLGQKSSLKRRGIRTSEKLLEGAEKGLLGHVPQHILVE